MAIGAEAVGACAVGGGEGNRAGGRRSGAEPEATGAAGDGLGGIDRDGEADGLGEGGESAEGSGERAMTLLDDIGLLSEVSFLRDFPVEQLRMLAFGSERRHVAEGEALYRAEESARGAWVVISGKIELALERGGRLEWSEAHERGSLLGETALIVPTRRFGSAFALEDSEALLIPRSLFLTLLRANPRLAGKMEARMRESVRRLAEEAARAGVRIASMPPLPTGSGAERVDGDGETGGVDQADRVSAADAGGGAGGDDDGGEAVEADADGESESQASGRLGGRGGGAGGGDGVGGSGGVE